MGEAKRRGSFEERKAQSIAKRQPAKNLVRRVSSKTAQVVSVIAGLAASAFSHKPKL